MARKTRLTFDDDAPELTEAELAEMRPAREVMNAEQFAAVTSVRRGRPKAKTHKVPVTIRLDPEVVETYRATGDGWQTRMNECLSRGAQRIRAGHSAGHEGQGRKAAAGPRAKVG